MDATSRQNLTAQLRHAGLTVTEDFHMHQATTFRLGGPTPLFVDCTDADQVERACALLRSNDLPFLLVGGGSNLLISDSGPGKAVVRLLATAHSPSVDGELVYTPAATTFDRLAEFCCEQGCDRLYNGSGIPGTVGGAIVGNAGAFGWQIADDLEELELLEPDGTRHWIPASDVRFAYRDSGLKHSSRIVLAAKLRLPPAPSTDTLSERRRILSLRASKHPDLAVDSCAGSFFRNLEPTSKAERRQAAGWFLEQAGAKKMRVGGAGVYVKHANIPIKAASNCKAADVAMLTQRMADAVREKFDLQLVREVQLIGEFESV